MSCQCVQGTYGISYSLMASTAPDRIAMKMVYGEGRDFECRILGVHPAFRIWNDTK